jgi:hypothetical protein
MYAVEPFIGIIWVITIIFKDKRLQAAARFGLNNWLFRYHFFKNATASTQTLANLSAHIIN